MSKQSVKHKKGKSSKTAPTDIVGKNGLIAFEAYLRAEQRDFEGGDPIDDWLVAEADIDSLMK